MTDEAKRIVDGIVCGGTDNDCENEDCFYNYLDGRTYSLKCAKGDIKSDAIRLIKRLSEENERLGFEVEQVKRERDAAVHDLAINRSCAVCKNEAGFKCAANGCAHENEWQWRGVCEENSGGDNDAAD